jgi:hypothetical protein
MSRFKRVFGTSAAGCLAIVVLGAGSAAAVAWGPLTSVYKGVVRVSGSGDFYNGGGIQVTTKYVISDRANDGNSVYGKTAYSFYRLCEDGTTRWCPDKSISTIQISNRTGTLYTSRPLKGDAEKARGQVQVCAQMGWPVPDSCSAAAIVTISY